MTATLPNGTTLIGTPQEIADALKLLAMSQFPADADTFIPGALPQPLPYVPPYAPIYPTIIW
jgi:hypothetical protein